jgi:hypothetical protein
MQKLILNRILKARARHMHEGQLGLIANHRQDHGKLIFSALLAYVWQRQSSGDLCYQCVMSCVCWEGSVRDLVS